jgi:4'-phosphopantetheinyl transferase
MSIEFNMIKCWYGRPEELPEDMVDYGFNEILSDTERARNSRYRHDRDRRLHLMARLMVRTLLSRYQQEISPHEWIFDQDLHGKPYISGPSDVVNRFHFNISHTDGLAVVAISRLGQVGVDVENPVRQTDYDGLAGRFFSRIEADHIKNADISVKASDFFRIWTLKEAYVKAIGKGLAHGLDSYWFRPTASDLAGKGRSELLLIDPVTGEFRAEVGWDCWSRQIGDRPGWLISVVARREAENQFGTDLEIQPWIF